MAVTSMSYVAKYIGSSYGSESVTLYYTLTDNPTSYVYHFTSIQIVSQNSTYYASKNFTVSFNGTSLYSTDSANVKTTKTISINKTVTISRTQTSKNALLQIVWPTHDTYVDSNGYAISTYVQVSNTYKVNFSIPAMPQYTITYDSNGGASVSTQYMWHGSSVSISFAPTKNGAYFEYWENSGFDGSIGDPYYGPGDTCAINDNLSLKAKWIQFPIVVSTYQMPTALAARANDPIAYRCSSSDPSTPNDEGDRIYIDLWAKMDSSLASTYKENWEGYLQVKVYTDKSRTSVFYSTAFDFEYLYDPTSPELYTEAATADHPVMIYFPIRSLLPSMSTTDENLYIDVCCWSYHYDLDYAYMDDDEIFSDINSFYVPTAFFSMDILAGGHGIAFGGPAKENAFLNYFESKFFADVMFETMIGVIQMFGGETPPNGWLICDGSYVSKTTYSKLWEVLGNTWGPSTSTTFALPDFRGRSPIGTKLPSSHSETYSNLIRDDTCSWVSEEYRPYIYYMSEDMTVSTQYTLQMWDVDVMCAGSNNRDASTVGVCVYWGGGSVGLVNIWADGHITYSATLDSYNVDTVSSRQIDSSSVLYHFPYLEVVFTTGATAGASPRQIHVYNSYPSSTETRYMKIGKVQLTKGSNLGIPWNASEFVHGHNKDKFLGSVGGFEGNTLTVDQLPSHTHGLNNHTHSVGAHSHPVGRALGLSAGTWAGETYSGSLSGSGAKLAHTTGGGTVSTLTSTSNNTAFNTGGNTGNTTATGNGQLISVLQPYATVNFIICTGILE